MRDALETSVACSPVSLKISQASIVPNARAAPAFSPALDVSSSHSIFVPEKYGSSTRPVRSRTSGSWPASLQLVAAVGGAAVLPDERAVQRLAGLGVPDADGLALVGDADRRQLAAATPGVVERLARDRAA